jgi:hypothetical protein
VIKLNFWRSLIAVLAGNLIYYGVERYLPLRAQHQIYRIDLGLAVDFWFCLACYGIVRMIR